MKLLINKGLILLMTLSGVLFFDSCKKDDEGNIDENKGYPVPTTYNFTNVNYSGQSVRLGMMKAMLDYIKTANNGATLDLTKLKNMYANTNNPFDSAFLNTSGKQIKDKVYGPDAGFAEIMFDSAVLASMSGVAGAPGVAGVVVSNDGTKKYLCGANGFDYAEIIGKSLMGSLLYYQIAAIYLSTDKIGDQVDNTTVKDGEGTPMEHHWDEAFGYMGIAKDFPANLTGAIYIGSYLNQRNTLLNCNNTVMNAFLKGRAAISNKDNATKHIQAAIIKSEIEKVFAATAISYLNKTKAALTDHAIRNHALSECYGFVLSLKYNPDKKISDSQLAQIFAYLGTDFYNVDTTKLDLAKDLLSTVYGLDAVKNQL